MYTSQSETPSTSSYAESTKYVADILSSMANGGVESSTFPMDYHHPYNVYSEYYNSQYASNAGYHTNPALMQHPGGLGQMRNFNMPPNHPAMSHFQHQQQHQHSHPHVPSFQHPKRPLQQHLSNNQNYLSSSSSTFVPNFLVSSGTGLTPTLTPTTLATIEQSFMELQHSGVRDPVTQSGFVPPVVEPSNSNSADLSQDSYDQTSSDSEYEPSAKVHVKNGVKGVDYIVTSTGTVNVAPQRKYTRRNKDEKLPPEEEERRRVRRERNKVAAAKCRQRRVDHTNELVDETDGLLAIQSRLESEIQSLKQERDQLEFILQAHQPLCKVNKSKVKMESTEDQQRASPHVNHHSHIPENLSKSSNDTMNESNKASPTVSLSTTSSLASARPNSLPLIKRDRARMLSMTSATGITINTPTSGVSITPSMLFCPDLDTMVDGSTGLTPITGMSCSSQVQNRGSNENNNNTENVGSPNLISL